MLIKELLAIRQSLPADSKAGSFHARYKISKFLKESEADAEFAHREYRKLLDEYSHINDKNELVVDKERIEEFNKKTCELDQMEIKDPSIKFSIKELSDFELSANDIIHLDPIIDE